MASVIPPDLELFLTGWLRSNITDIPGLQVGNRIPDGYDGSYPLVVVRDDGGTQSADRVTFDDLENGHVFTGKLLPKRVPGGIVLTEVGYTLKY